MEDRRDRSEQCRRSVNISLADIRNKLTAPKVALERLAKGEKVPREFLESFNSLRSLMVSLSEFEGGAQLAAKEMEAAIALLGELREAPDRG